jgi:tetratricopeptide (TPR) repeat protein
LPAASRVCKRLPSRKASEVINLLIALAAGLAAFLATAAAFSWLPAIFPGLIVAIGVYIWLAQKALKEINVINEKAQKEMMAQRVDRAVEVFRSGFPLARKQFLVGPVLHANVGMLLYMKGDFEAARPHLQQGFARNYMARAMLACWYFKQKDPAKMRAEFEQAVKYGKKEGLVWSVYAYCLQKLGERDEAAKVLARAVEANPADERLKKSLLALQNNKPMKMRVYGPQFYQFHLEPLPPELGGGGGRRVTWQRR